MVCGFQFALRNILSFKLNFCVEMFSCVLCDEKENSEYNLSFWPNPHSRSYRSGFQAAHVLIIYNRVQIQKKPAFQLRCITKFFVPYQAQRTDDFYQPSSLFEILLYRSMLTILLSALIIINLLNWIPV